MITADRVDSEVAKFAQGVRLALNDLTPDEIDDLTDGLEADLADQLADDPAGLGDPAEYAAELRSAAGLRARDEGSSNAHRVSSALARIRDSRARGAAFIDSQPALRGIVDLLNSLRPVWWVARGLLLSLPFTYNPMFYGDQPAMWLINAAAVIVSVQWGRKKWMPQPALFAVTTVASLFALAVVPPTIDTLASLARLGRYGVYESDLYQGLAVAGDPISNIFAYDANGELLTDVQLFDQSGRPLSVGVDSGSPWRDWYDDVNGESYYLLPRDSAPVVNPWNVFPLRVAPFSAMDFETGMLRSDELGTEPTPPFLQVQPLIVDDEDVAEPGAATPDSDAGPTPSPSHGGTAPEE